MSTAEFLATGGLPVAVLLGLAVVWAVVSVVWTLLAITRIRVPAPLWWLFPALVLTAGGALSLWEASQVDAALALMGDDPRTTLQGLAESSVPLYVAALITAVGLGINAPFLAAANIVRAGDFPRWKVAHAIPAAIAVLGAPLGLLASIPTAVVGLSGGLAIAVASIRLGAGDDRRRMVAGRAFVGAIAMCAPLALGIAHVVGNRLAVLHANVHASYAERADLLDAADAALPWLLAGDGLVAASLFLASLGTLLPVSRAVIDGRTSGGLLFSAFLAILPALAVTPALLPLLDIQSIDEHAERQAALRDTGIELVEIPRDLDATSPWSPGTTVTVGVYWARVDDERVLPFKEGRVDDSELDEGHAMSIATAIRPLRFDPVRIEVDRRADVHRLAPVLLALRQAGIDDACFVVRSRTGRFACLPVQLDAPTNEKTQLLLRSVDATVIEGEADPEFIEMADSEARLDGAEPPIVVHPDREISAQRLLESVAHITAVSDAPLMAL
jgi:hypothetical protein